MNHTKIIKYIKSHFKNILDENIKFYEQIIKNNYMKPIANTHTQKKYTLKNPLLYEDCIINSIEDLNRQLSSESNEYAKQTDQIIQYILSLDNNCFNSKIDITDDIRILPIRIEKTPTNNNDVSDNNDDSDEQLTIDTTNKINIISIEMNNYFGYILYETLDNIQ